MQSQSKLTPTETATGFAHLHNLGTTLELFQAKDTNHQDWISGQARMSFYCGNVILAGTPTPCHILSINLTHETIAKQNICKESNSILWLRKENVPLPILWHWLALTIFSHMNLQLCIEKLTLSFKGPPKVERSSHMNNEHECPSRNLNIPPMITTQRLHDRNWLKIISMLPAWWQC